MLDRFGLYIEVTTENEVERRIEIVESRELFERDAEKFAALCEPEQKKLRQKIARARRSFATVKLDKSLLRQIATLCSELQVDGHRGELTIMRAARALAAFAGRKSASEEDVRRVAKMSLRHRLHAMRCRKRQQPQRSNKRWSERFLNLAQLSSGRTDEGGGDSNRGGKAGVSDPPRSGGKNRSDAQAHNGDDSDKHTPAWTAGDSQLPRLFRDLQPPQNLKIRHGRSGSQVYNPQHGQYVRAGLHKGGARIAMDATLRALHWLHAFKRHTERR